MRTYITLFLIFTYQSFIVSHADTLLIQEVNKSINIQKPTRGLTMSQVISQFGEPLVKKNPVGNPPITQWVYKDFTVYFENKWVIQAVISKKKKN